MRWYGDEPFSCDVGDRWTDDEGVERVSALRATDQPRRRARRGDRRWVTITRPPSDEKLELLEIDRVLGAEGVPHGDDRERWTRQKRIRWLGDRGRAAARYKVVGGKIIEGQMTVDDCIAEVERDIAARPPWDGHA
jgi:hypothetical protein